MGYSSLSSISDHFSTRTISKISTKYIHTKATTILYLSMQAAHALLDEGGEEKAASLVFHTTTERREPGRTKL